ncbi:MAG: ABC transporter ATP-binding protein [Candidatus Sumerlaeaceae bacterium]
MTQQPSTTPNAPTPAVEIRGLVRRYGKTEAVDGLNLTVRQGRCFGLFGRNGAGKSTTMKCLLNHLRPSAGVVKVFGKEPQYDEVGVKTHIGYVPEVVAFHPWMSAREVLDYSASFRRHWNRDVEMDLLARFDMDPNKRVDSMSKGMRSQLGLVCAVCPEPDLLLLDEPTSGLDPIVRREFLQTVIGAYLDAAPGQRTVLVSTHLIHEWEGLIDEFTIIDKGRDILTLESEIARQRCKRVHLRWMNGNRPANLGEFGVVQASREDGVTTILTNEYSDDLHARLKALNPAEVEVENLTLEEIFIATGTAKGGRL